MSFAKSALSPNWTIAEFKAGRRGDRWSVQPDGCWIWNGHTNSAGYGRFDRPGGVVVNAHREMYELVHGCVVPETMHVHHLCRNRACVNPDHLEAVDAKTHLREHKTKTHCIRGHAFDEANTRISVRKDGRERRACRACDRIKAKARPWHLSSAYKRRQIAKAEKARSA